MPAGLGHSDLSLDLERWMGVKGGWGELEKSGGGGDVLPVSVVNQESNGGEPKQMLTGCLVNSTLP